MDSIPRFYVESLLNFILHGGTNFNGSLQSGDVDRAIYIITSNFKCTSLKCIAMLKQKYVNVALNI